MTIQIEGIECGTPSEALSYCDADPHVDAVVTIGGRHFAVRKAEAERLDNAGAVSARWFDRDGVLVSVPAK